MYTICTSDFYYILDEIPLHAILYKDLVSNCPQLVTSADFYYIYEMPLHAILLFVTNFQFLVVHANRVTSDQTESVNCVSVSNETVVIWV